MKKYIVEVTDTWRVEVEAKSEVDAYNKVTVMDENGYNNAIDCDGAEINVIEEDEE